MGRSLLVSATGDGWQNLATEEYLVDHTGPDDAVFFFYRNDNAVIIGRNQNPWAECCLSRMEAEGVQLVRRISGGGAVYHDGGNLNYSFIMGRRCYDLSRQMNLILESVRAVGIPCEYSGRNDILAGGKKFSGNAFCERGEARLHHGTLLVHSDLEKLERYLTPDPGKLASKGIRSVRSRVCNLSGFVPGIRTETLLQSLKDACRREYGACPEVPAESLRGEELTRYIARHASAAWTLGRTPKFDYEVSHRFPWGGVQLLLCMSGGMIESLQVYSDANDVLLAERIDSLLHGAAFRSGTMAAALRQAEDSRMDDLADYLLALDL